MHSRLGELGLQSIDVGGAGNHHMRIRTAGGDKKLCL